MRRVLAALFLLVSLSAGASTYTVDDLGDAGDANPGDDICASVDFTCTLRAAIEEANATLGADVIEFSVVGAIVPETDLPSITEQLTIDGTTAPGYTTEPLVSIDGVDFLLNIGLHFAAGSNDSELIALEITGFAIAGVIVDSDAVTIRRNYLGPVPEGAANFDGLQLNGTGSTVGGAGEGNVISGNDQHGIAASGTGHQILANEITSNGDDGINATGSSLTIGASGEGNVISNNFDTGVTIDGGTGTVVAGNIIGLDSTGTTAMPNFIGVEVNSAGNTIGTAAARNVISGNDDDGIDINASDTIVHNNFIGPDVTGAIGIGNAGFGIAAFIASNVDIGGSGVGEENVVSFNGAEGIFFFEVDGSRITNNLIGLDAAGTSILGNGLEGILLIDSADVTVASNTVSGNSTGGIVDAGGILNILELNRVGTTADGSAAAGNLATGIELFATVDTIVRSNVVSANDGHGIETTFGAAGSVLHSNIVGLSADLSTPLGNQLDGINVCDGSSDTVVGSVALGGNIISANVENGIGVEPTALAGNTWAANSIFDNDMLGIDIGIDGVTPNDPDDPDTGANEYQNFPELTAAVTTPSASQILGTIDTLPDTPFTVHFYSSPAADPSGFGEGQTYLGETSGTTDANGDATFSFTGPALASGDVVTATATTADGTSEFSEPLTVDPAPVIVFSSATYTAGEADGNATIMVTRSGNLDAVSTVQYTTADNTASGSDYTTASGTLTFVAGDDTETFLVPITNDTTDEPSEIVDLTLSNPTAATLGEPSDAELTITDDDPEPTVTIDDDTENEGTTLTFTLTLSNPSASDVTVSYTTTDDTATAGSDYTAQANDAIITAGSLTTTVNVPTTGDADPESVETFFLDLTGATNATITDDQGLGTIIDDDTQADLTITKTAAEPTFTPGDPVTFTITVENLGPSTATSLTVTDVLPPGTTLVSATGPDATCSGTTTVTCTIPTLASGASTAITLILNTNTVSPIANTASVAAAAPADPTPFNNAATATVNPTGIDAVPTVTEWGLLLLALALGMIAMRRT